MEMEEDDVMVEIRMKYAEDLEDILQCPICFHRPTGSVPICAEGHHICNTCQAKLTVCPVCNSPYKGTRNYLAENLCPKLDDILSSLLDPRHSLNKRVVQNKRCVGTQTNTSTVSQGTLSLDNNHAEAKRMCRIGFCQSEHASDRMYTHVRDCHKANVIEANGESGGYIKNWNFEYSLSKLYDYAIQIKNMGLFFFNIFINEAGQLFGNLEIVHSSELDVQFHYTLLITNSATKKSLGFDGQVQSLPQKEKFPFTCTFDKDLFSSFFQEDSISLKEEINIFTCRLFISYELECVDKPETDTYDLDS